MDSEGISSAVNDGDWEGRCVGIFGDPVGFNGGLVDGILVGRSDGKDVGFGRTVRKNHSVNKWKVVVESVLNVLELTN